MRSFFLKRKIAVSTKAVFIFVVNINLKTGERKIIDPSGIPLGEEDMNFLAKILAKEIVKNLLKK